MASVADIEQTLTELVRDCEDPELTAKFAGAIAKNVDWLPQSAKDEVLEGLRQEVGSDHGKQADVDDKSMEMYRNLKRLGMMLLLPENTAMRASFEQSLPQFPEQVLTRLQGMNDAHQDFLKRHNVA